MKDDEILKQYLLGALNEEQAGELERRLLAEEELFELAEAVEGDLLLAAVRGGLSPAERGRVLRRASASPEGRARLALIRGLVPPGREEVPVPTEIRLFRLLARPEVRAALAAACLAFVAGGSWLATQVALPDSATWIGGSVPTEPGPDTPRPGPAVPPADRIAEHPPVPAPPAPRRPVPDREPSVRPEPTSLVFQLALSVARSGGGGFPRLEIPRGTRPVEIQLLLEEGEPFTTFTASLRNASTGEEIRRKERIPAGEVDGQRAVVLSVPSSKLVPGIYEIELRGITSEEDKLVGQRTFEVVST